MEVEGRKRKNTIGNVANEHYLPGCGAVGWHLDRWWVELISYFEDKVGGGRWWRSEEGKVDNWTCEVELRQVEGRPAVFLCGLGVVTGQT